MRAVILVDRETCVREQAMLARLEIGLADEGVRIAHAVPGDLLRAAGVGVYSASVGYRDRGFPWTLGARVEALAADIAEAFDIEGTGGVEVVHVMGDRAAGAGQELARIFGSAFLMDLSGAGSVAIARRIEAAGKERVGTRRYLAADGATATLARGWISSDVVVSASWGVHSPSRAKAPLDAGRSVSVAMLLEGCGHRAVAVALEGVASVRSGDAPLLVFASAEGTERRALWRDARRLKMLDRLSLVPDIEALRDPIYEMDVLLIPGPMRRVSTLVLEAMAHGVIVLAASEQGVESFIDGVTCRLVRAGSGHGGDAWREALESLLVDEEGNAALVESARAWVKEHRSASRQVGAVLRVYDEVAAKAGAA